MVGPDLKPVLGVLIRSLNHGSMYQYVAFVSYWKLIIWPSMAIVLEVM